MKKVLFVFSVIALAMLLSIPASAQSEGKPVIGIKAFENPPNYANSTIGNGLTDLFTTELQKTGRYKIIERAHVQELTDEVDFGKSGYVEQKSAVRKGHIKGVQYYFLAKVTNFGAKTKNVGAGGFGGGAFGGLGYKKDEAYVRLDYRIVDATSAEVVYADYGEATYSKSGMSFGGGAWGHGGGALDLSSSEFLESMVGRATLMAIANAIDKMDHGFMEKHKSRASELAEEESKAQTEAVEALRKQPGKVLAVVSKEMVIVNLGANNGLKVGDKLILLKTVDTKNAKGEVVFSEEKEVGSLEVFDVQPDRSRARVVTGTAAEGMTVKLQ